MTSANADLVRSIYAAWARCQAKTVLERNGGTAPRTEPGEDKRLYEERE